MSARLPPTRQMLAAIGEVAAESAEVEQLMRVLFGRLIDSPYGEIITAGEDLSRICQMCLRVAQYNLALDDQDVEMLGAIVKAIDATRVERNFFVHSRWERTSTPRTHAGMRSARPSGRENGSDQTELWYCTPDDAIGIADDFRQIATAIERFMERRFPEWHHPYPQRRSGWKKMEELFGPLMGRGRSTPDPDTAATKDAG